MEDAEMIAALDARGVDTTEVNVKPDDVHWLGEVAFARDGEMKDGRPGYTFTLYDGDDEVTTDGGDLEYVADEIASILTRRREGQDR